jgi:hypothetical protein
MRKRAAPSGTVAGAVNPPTSKQRVAESKAQERDREEKEKKEEFELRVATRVQELEDGRKAQRALAVTVEDAAINERVERRLAERLRVDEEASRLLEEADVARVAQSRFNERMDAGHRGDSNAQGQLHDFLARMAAQQAHGLAEVDARMAAQQAHGLAEVKRELGSSQGRIQRDLLMRGPDRTYNWTLTGVVEGAVSFFKLGLALLQGPSPPRPSFLFLRLFLGWCVAPMVVLGVFLGVVWSLLVWSRCSVVVVLDMVGLAWSV